MEMKSKMWHHSIDPSPILHHDTAVALSPLRLSHIQ